MADAEKTNRDFDITTENGSRHRRQHFSGTTPDGRWNVEAMLIETTGPDVLEVLAGTQFYPDTVPE